MKLTEKQKNCPYCQNEDPADNLAIYVESGSERIAIGSTGDLEVDEGSWIFEENFYEYRDNLLKYCPMCGRPLNEEKE